MAPEELDDEAAAELAELPTSWREPAHPSAQVVVRESLAAMDRLHGHLDALDAKASYLGAGVFALTAGFIAGVATKPPVDPHVQDVMVAAFLLDLIALLFVGDAWWPRSVDVPPHPKGLREHHFNDTKRVAARKARSIKIGLVVLGAAAAASSIVMAASLLQGGSY
jgi:hypothetical protein